jgi:hypothetical protein
MSSDTQGTNSSKRRDYGENVEHPESSFTCGTGRGTMVLSERERGKNMWSVFNKNTGECVKSGFWGIFEAMDWIGEQSNWYELEADDRCPF